MKKKEIDKYLKIVGDRIKNQREKNNYSIEKFSELVGISRMQLYRIEGVKVNTTIAVIKKMAVILDIRPGELLDA